MKHVKPSDGSRSYFCFSLNSPTGVLVVFKGILKHLGFCGKENLRLTMTWKSFPYYWLCKNVNTVTITVHSSLLLWSPQDFSDSWRIKMNALYLLCPDRIFLILRKNLEYYLWRKPTIPVTNRALIIYHYWMKVINNISFIFKTSFNRIFGGRGYFMSTVTKKHKKSRVGNKPSSCFSLVTLLSYRWVKLCKACLICAPGFSLGVTTDTSHFHEVAWTETLLHLLVE